MYLDCLFLLYFLCIYPDLFTSHKVNIQFDYLLNFLSLSECNINGVSNLKIYKIYGKQLFLQSWFCNKGDLNKINPTRCFPKCNRGVPPAATKCIYIIQLYRENLLIVSGILTYNLSYRCYQTCNKGCF